MELKTAMWVSIIWIVLVIIFMIFMLRKYTFGDWDETHKNPYQKETLGIPRGVLRSILTLSILFVVILLQVSTLYVKPMDVTILGKVFENITITSDEALNNILGKLLIPEERFSQLMIAFQMVIAFYFGGKVMHHVTHAERKVAENQAKKSAEEAIERTRIITNKGFEDDEAAG